MRAFSAIGFASLGVFLFHCGTSSNKASGHPDGSVSSTDGGGHRDTGVDSGHVKTPVDGGTDAKLAFDAGDASTANDAALDAAGDVIADVNTVIEAGPCGTRTGMRGLTSRSVIINGHTRTYLIYLPASFNPLTPMPFVFVFHGFTMSGHDMYEITQYTAIADAEGIGLAFPDGDGGPNTISAPWNDENPGQLVCGGGQYIVGLLNDFAFIDDMKADVAHDQCLDTSHIFSTGFSMGGYFTHHIGCYRSDMRAIAPHSGGTIDDLSVCTTGHVPVIIFHGTADSVIDDACDDPTVTPDFGFPPSATLWAAKNGCANTFTTIPADSDAGGNGQCYLYDGCPSDGQVEACTFTGMDHCWAGGSLMGDAGSACPTYASATQLEWQFFKKYAW